MRVLLLALLTIIVLQGHTQDSVSTDWHFSKQLRFWNEWEGLNYADRIRMPSYLKNIRRSSTTLPIRFDSISDNPLQHGAAYVALSTRTDYRNRISLFADLYAEHRGTSYGVFDKSNIVLFPVIRFEGRDTIGNAKKSWAFLGKGGAFLNEVLDEGLMIYNIDVQGIQFSATHGKFSSDFRLYGDLQNGIGLQIDDLYSVSANWKFKQGSGIGASVSIAKTYFQNMLQESYLNVFGHLRSGDYVIYGQAGYRPYRFSSSEIADHAALLLGIKNAALGHGRLRADLNAAFRYYGAVYNLGRYDGMVRYRKAATDLLSMYGNTVGKYLYPLRRVDAAFSQWAVATEYTGFNVSMASVNGRISFLLSGKIKLFCEPDLNYVHAVNRHYLSSTYFYPFFDGGLSYQPAPNTAISFSATNKAMNLDLAYPSSYLLSKPCFKLSLKACFFDDLKTRDVFIQ